jgi:hypothetical protein
VPFRRWLPAVAGAAAAALLVGVPTDIVDTSLFTRMTPVRWWDYPVWVLSAVLAGLIVATYFPLGAGSPRRRGGGSLSATVLSAFAVGCPVCNKLVVAVLGVSGALSYWAPVQPVLAILSLALLATGFYLRLGGEVSCAVQRG